LRNFVGFCEVFLKLDGFIKVFLSECLAELVKSIFQACLLFDQFLVLFFFLLLCEGLLLFIVIGNSINVFGLNVGAVKRGAIVLISNFINLNKLVLM
jgi:hypothetical protein